MSIANIFIETNNRLFELGKENHELKEEIKRLKKEIIKLKEMVNNEMGTPYFDMEKEKNKQTCFSGEIMFDPSKINDFAIMLEGEINNLDNSQLHPEPEKYQAARILLERCVGFLDGLACLLKETEHK